MTATSALVAGLHLGVRVSSVCPAQPQQHGDGEEERRRRRRRYNSRRPTGRHRFWRQVKEVVAGWGRLVKALEFAAPLQHAPLLAPLKSDGSFSIQIEGLATQHEL
jgi:hypothetical protein